MGIDPGWNPRPATEEDKAAHLKSFFENNVSLTENFTAEELEGDDFISIGQKLCAIYSDDRWEAGI